MENWRGDPNAGRQRQTDYTKREQFIQAELKVQKTQKSTRKNQTLSIYWQGTRRGYNHTAPQSTKERQVKNRVNTHRRLIREETQEGNNQEIKGRQTGSKTDIQFVRKQVFLYLNNKNFNAIMRQGNTKGLEEMEAGLRQQSASPENRKTYKMNLSLEKQSQHTVE